MRARWWLGGLAACAALLSALLVHGVQRQASRDLLQRQAPQEVRAKLRVAPRPWGRAEAAELGLIVNDADPLSVRVGEYYAQRRGVPAENVVHVRFPRAPDLAAAEFLRVKREVDAALPTRVQFLALAWTAPYRVGCMSVTSAFAFGFRSSECVSGCKLTAVSPYFDAETHFPYRDLHMRPAMLLAASDFPHAQALIDRGIEADDSAPFGTAYLLDTSDTARNVRAGEFAATLPFSWRIGVQIIRADALWNRTDVLFYFTGVPRVSGLETLRFLPGAIADHLTSHGGAPGLLADEQSRLAGSRRHRELRDGGRAVQLRGEISSDTGRHSTLPRR